MSDLPTTDQIARLPPEGGGGFNRLVHSSSPYLLQHCRNPVDWYPWGDEAFAKARHEGKPVFLSVGYSSCHWCHVMERESFENGDVSALLNQHFVSIKVDREERPDIDEIYMTATQLFSGRGGWPNSLFLTPDRRPFFAGTYFPPEDGWGRPGFKSLLRQLSGAWTTRRVEIERQAARITDEMRAVSMGGATVGPGELDAAVIDAALADLKRSFDPEHGGFGQAPKFPPHGALELMLAALEQGSDPALLAMATRTLDAMIRGGIHDQLAGGFARYSTDDLWLLPHFEKMLYDNAQLLAVLPRYHALTGSLEYRRAAEGIVDWAFAEMRHAEGGFFSALDADSEGEEGKCYLWSKDEIEEVLGGDDGAWFAEVFAVTDRGNFVDPIEGTSPERNILHWEKAPEELVKGEGIPVDEIFRRVDSCRTRLLAHRRKRIAPFRDDKILASWNGLMIRGLAIAGVQFERSDWIDAARRAAGFVLDRMTIDGRLVTSWRDGKVSGLGFLDDYAFMADGLLALYAATGEERWLTDVIRLVEVILERFSDPVSGGFHLTADDHEELLFRPRDPFDKAQPSGNGVTARVFLELHAATGEERYRRECEKTLRSFAPLMNRAARAMQSMVVALIEYRALSDSRARPATPSVTHEGESVTVTRGPVTITVTAFDRNLKRGSAHAFTLEVGLPRGWHLNANQPLDERLVPTTVTMQPNRSVILRDVAYPSGTVIESAGDRLRVYEAGTVLEATLYAPSDARPGRTVVRLEVECQPCSMTECLERATLPVELDLEIT